MKYPVLIFYLCISECLVIGSEHPLRLISTAHSLFLRQYGGYTNTTIKHFEIPEETIFASFKFERIDDFNTSTKYSDCQVKNISVVLKPRSLPLVSTPETQFPAFFKNLTRLNQFYTELSINQDRNYINLTAPEPGCYFLLAFLVNGTVRKRDGCNTHLKISLFTAKKSFAIIGKGTVHNLSLPQFHSTAFKFFVPQSVSHAILILDSAKKVLWWQINVRPRRPPLPKRGVHVTGANSHSPFAVSFAVEAETWHFVELISTNFHPITFHLTLRYSHWPNNTRVFEDKEMNYVTQYQELVLFRESSNHNFGFSYHLQTQNQVTLNTWEIAVLKFEVRDHVDVGGTLQFNLSFKDNDRVVVGCLRLGAVELPTRTGFCRLHGQERPSPLFLNGSAKTDTVMVPYPESGTWYATFRLFPEDCMPCSCPEQCKEAFGKCRKQCFEEAGCSYACKMEVITTEKCLECDCDGLCSRQKSDKNSSISFDVSSVACAENCSLFGMCTLLVGDGVVFGACDCSNSHKGWNCWVSNPVPATSAATVAELVLLVLSNVLFLPAIYLALRRRYLSEAVAYSAVFFFSTFYHACDADTVSRPVRFCIASWDSLQFGDFYSAVLAVWITLIAVADLRPLWRPVLYVAGAVFFAFLLVTKPTAVWVSMMPAAVGAALVAASWFCKWRKMGLRFVAKRYVFIQVPLAVAAVSLGLLFFGLLVTTDNYVYFHSLWHVVMAGAIMLALPKHSTFKNKDNL